MKIQIKSLLFLTLGFSFLITSCSRNPVTGKKELSLMSESQEKSMGLEYDPQIQAEYGMYADSSWQRYLREKGGSMARISHRPNLGFQFRVIDSEVVNAFAVPGGYIYFTRGILAHFNSEAQLMGVMGHEIGHVTARHANEQYSKQMLAQIGLIAGMVLSPKFREFSDLANTGVQMLFLKFSRDNESQSDKLGVEYSSKVGYDAAHMADFFKTLGRLSDAQGARIPSFMSTHPDPGDRFNKVKTMAADKKKEFPQATKVERNAYLNRLDGMIYGKDPKQGFKEGDVFYHPELKFQFPTPNDWAYENTPSKVQFSTKDQKAIMVLSLAAEKDLNSAASAHISHYKLKTIRQDRATVNGLSAIYILAELPPEQQAATTQEQAANTLRVGTMLILHNGMVFNITGVTAQNDFNAYESAFNKTMNGFKVLTDPSKLNVKPEKIAIKTVNKQMSLRDALNQFNQDSKRHEELSILNGMMLTDAVSQGTLIKTITK